MGAESKIEWCDSTFNPWRGCTKISPACDHCYAEALVDTRLHQAKWGPGQPRVRTSPHTWQRVKRWHETPYYECDCGYRGTMEDLTINTVHGCNLRFRLTRRRVFGGSLCDWLDNEVPIEWLVDLLELIRRTPNLDWLLLSKRIGNWAKRLAEAVGFLDEQAPDAYPLALRDWIANWLDGEAPANVWLGATICNQPEADRDVPKLQDVPARVRFVSVEPMLGAIDFTKLRREGGDGWTYLDDALRGFRAHKCGGSTDSQRRIHWVITGGESGAHARPSHPDWFRSLRDECEAAGTAYLHKQNGEWVSVSEIEGDGPHFTFSDHATVRRIGKKAAGRLLDGRIHSEFPRVGVAA